MGHVIAREDDILRVKAALRTLSYKERPREKTAMRKMLTLDDSEVSRRGDESGNCLGEGGVSKAGVTAVSSKHDDEDRAGHLSTMEVDLPDHEVVVQRTFVHFS